MAQDNTCCKYLMFFFNLLVFLGGVALLAVGVWVTVEADSFKQLVSTDPAVFTAVYIIIAVGSLLLVVGFLGCCGAIKENKCLLGTFFICVLLLFIVEVVGGVLAFIFYPDAEQAARDSMKMYHNDTPEGLSIKSAWDNIQEAFQCCGLDGPQDWVAASVYPLPCITPLEGCKNAFQSYFWVLGGIACGILFIELLAMVFACCLYQNVRKERYA